MKKINVGLTVFIVAMLGACDRSPRAITLPEVNDENCRKEAVLEWVEENNLSKEQMWEFTGKCARRNRMVLGEAKEWGPSDLVLDEPRDIDERKR